MSCPSCILVHRLLKLQFHFLLNIVRKRKRFSKWEKQETFDDVEAVKEYYGYSNEKARSALTLLSPDGGALKKIYKLSQHLGGIEVIECSKRRDVKTGKLSGFISSIKKLLLRFKK